jgi:hypothetical protein
MLRILVRGTIPDFLNQFYVFPLKSDKSDQTLKNGNSILNQPELMIGLSSYMSEFPFKKVHFRILSLANKLTEI